MDFRQRLERLEALWDKVCCLLKSGGSGGSGGGIESVITEDSNSLDFNGEGTPLNPLSANLKISNQNGNSLQSLSDGAFVEFIPPLINIPNGLISGGFVSWTGVGLIFDIGPTQTEYAIDGTIYTIGEAQVTLAVGDVTNPRLDVIALDITGVIVIQGTPAADPQIPTVDPQTQIALTTVLVNANATTPNITETIVYDENVEWTTTATATANFVAINHPVHGTKNIRITGWNNPTYIRFTNGSVISTVDINVIRLTIFLTTAISSTRNINVTLYNGAVGVSQTLSLTNYGLSKTAVGVDQVIAVPISQFALSSTNFNRIEFRSPGTGAVNLSIDYIVLQRGFVTYNSITNITTQPVYPNIATLRNNTGNAASLATVLGYYAKGDQGGGQFYYDITSVVGDNGGTIIKPNTVSGAGRWIRIITNGIYNLREFGGKPDQTNDCSAIFNIIDSVIPGMGVFGDSTVIIPAGTYRFDTTVTPTKSYNIIGGGGGSYVDMATKLIFGTNVSGFEFFRENGVNDIRVENLYLKGTNTGVQNSTHGINTNGRVFMKNVAIQTFGGNGLNIDATLSGNADSAAYDDITTIENLGHGIYVAGNDSNNINFKNIFGNANGKSNIYDNSFLGNKYEGVHTSYAGMIAGNRSWVTHGGTYYVAIAYPSHVNIEPGVVVGWENYWVHFVTMDVPSVATAWNNATTYYCSSAMALVGAASYNIAMAPYTEGGQAGIILVGNSMVIGGDHGAGFVGNTPRYLGTGDGGEFVAFGGIRVYDKDDNNFYTDMSVSLGLAIGHFTGGGIQMKSFPDKYTRVFANNSAGDTGFYWFNPNVAGTPAGRSGNIPPAIPMIGRYGMMMSDIDNITNYRVFRAGIVIPSAAGNPQEAGVGDFVINIDPATLNIFGWRCTVAGNPGTWAIDYRHPGGANGSFTTVDGKTVTVVNGIITTIV